MLEGVIAEVAGSVDAIARTLGGVDAIARTLGTHNDSARKDSIRTVKVE